MKAVYAIIDCYLNYLERWSPLVILLSITAAVVLFLNPPPWVQHDWLQVTLPFGQLLPPILLSLLFVCVGGAHEGGVLDSPVHTVVWASIPLVPLGLGIGVCVWNRRRRLPTALLGTVAVILGINSMLGFMLIGT
jgi:hypothetical protein